MTTEMLIQLEATAVRFYSQYDESTFFRWLKDLPCVDSVDGKGMTIFIKVRPVQVSEDMLRDLLALFRRYGVNKKQLAQFDRPDFSDWFRSPNAPWHAEVFG
jgi:hypothetical protein